MLQGKYISSKVKLITKLNSQQTPVAIPVYELHILFVHFNEAALTGFKENATFLIISLHQCTAPGRVSKGTALKHSNDVSALIQLGCVMKMTLNETPCTIIIEFQLQSLCFYVWHEAVSIILS